MISPLTIRIQIHQIQYRTLITFILNFYYSNNSSNLEINLFFFSIARYSETTENFERHYETLRNTLSCCSKLISIKCASVYVSDPFLIKVIESRCLNIVSGKKKKHLRRYLIFYKVIILMTSTHHLSFHPESARGFCQWYRRKQRKRFAPLQSYVILDIRTSRYIFKSL